MGLGRIFATAAMAMAPVAAAADGLSIVQRGAWTVEIVSYEARAACTAFVERDDGVAAFVSWSSDSPFVLPVFELLAKSEPDTATDPLLIVVGALRVPAVVEIDTDEEGVYIATHPDIDRADEVISSMLSAPDVRVVVGDIVLSALSLEGFDAAYEDVRSACGA